MAGLERKNKFHFSESFLKDMRELIDLGLITSTSELLKLKEGDILPHVDPKLIQRKMHEVLEEFCNENSTIEEEINLLKEFIVELYSQLFPEQGIMELCLASYQFDLLAKILVQSGMKTLRKPTNAASKSELGRPIWDLAEKAQAEVDKWPDSKRRAADMALVTRLYPKLLKKE